MHILTLCEPKVVLRRGWTGSVRQPRVFSFAIILAEDLGEGVLREDTVLAGDGVAMFSVSATDMRADKGVVNAVISDVLD